LLYEAFSLGMFENRQMNASKPADYVGMPRSTMDLEELERVGRVDEGARQASNLYRAPSLRGCLECVFTN
jgi:hypothetical protein